MRVPAAVMAACAALACVAGPASAQPPAPVPVPETPPGTPAAMFVDDPSIVDAYPNGPQAWSRTADERAVRLHFTIGTPDCYGASATVRETAEDVIVDLRTGTLPRAAGRACIMIALFAGLDVPLQSPLGARRVLSVT
ncbi:MAG: hypothetical protein U1D00_35405 [Mycobacterium sp.]|nr:hypothetical protein [Mycobacterium sp.]